MCARHLILFVFCYVPNRLCLISIDLFRVINVSTFVSFSCPGGSSRFEAIEPALRRRERRTGEPAHLRLWIREAAQSWQRPSDDAVLHGKLRRSWGELFLTLNAIVGSGEVFFFNQFAIATDEINKKIGS